MAKKKTTDVKKLTKSVLDELLNLLGIETEYEISTKKEKSKEGPVESVEVKLLNEEEKGLLIGRRGATLLAIQSFLGIVLKRETGDWVRVIVNIGDWREKQEEYLNSLAEQTAERVRDTGEAQHLYNLTASQRRIVHMSLSSMKDIKTESVGEGDERYLIVSPKAS